jgi:2-methylcitrate dehydratase PrpD
MTTDSHSLAQFATSIDLASVPDAVREKLKITLLHNLAMVRAGSALAGPALQLAKDHDGPGAASLLHDGRKVTLERAVLANAAMLHARTQDDTHLPAITHLAATCLPALVAVAETHNSSGVELLSAMLAAYEGGAAVAVDVGPACSSRALRPSSVLGGVAASIGAARLMGLDATAIQSAIGLAASFGGGTGQTWVAATDEWQYQVGVAGRNGLLAAELAAAGATGAPDALEGAAGLYLAATGTRDPHRAPMRLGEHWRTLEVTYKPFPICAINQMPVTVLLAMMGELEFTAEDIDTMELRLSPPEAAYPGTDTYGPFASASGSLMSAPFCLAVAAREGTVTRAMVENHDEPSVAALAQRIRVVSDESLVPGECVIGIQGARGQFSSEQVETPTTFNWNFEEVHRRLVDMGEERGMTMSTLDGLAECIAHLERHDVNDLVRALTRP